VLLPKLIFTDINCELILHFLFSFDFLSMFYVLSCCNTDMLKEAATAAVSAAASAAAVELYEAGRSLVGRIINYEGDLESNYKRLIEQTDMLYATRDGIVAGANKHKTNEVTKREYWISRVKKIEEEVRELEAKFKKENRKGKRILGRRSHSQLCISMTKKYEELHNLWVEGQLLVEKLPEAVRTMHAPKTEDKPSLHWAIKEILDLLRDRNIRRIGLWGMPGIGKTTIMKSLNDNKDITKMFDIVICVKVPESEPIKMLQNAITQRLKLNVEGVINPDEIALRISKELECKRYLLLLDEVRDILDLHMIGILDNKKDSKVVLATRYRDICFDFDTDEQIKLKCLSEADAYKMFREKVGRNINLPRIEPIAKLVASECAGLPLLIDKVARAFKKKDNFELWSDGLRSLRRWPSIKEQGRDELIESLKFCYEDLHCEDKKFCFLYSALYPEDFEIYIDYLLECWRAESFIHDANKFRVAREKGHTMLHELINVSLLERSDKINYVRMNKVLRKMALQISSESNNFKVLVRTPQEQRQLPDEVEWQNANRISLMDNELRLLPEMPNCKNLSTLLLQRNRDLRLIPEPFFGLMQNLRVLDLQGTGISSLPSSISCFMCLKALYLNDCVDLMKLPSDIKKLMDLEVLDIRNTRINYLPIQIGCLTQLKCLRMSLSNFGLGQSRAVEFHRNVLSKLSLLEELRIDVDPNNRTWQEVVRAIIEEVATLTHLTSLSICFPSMDCLEFFISKSPSWKDLYFTFQFSVGHHDSTRYQILDYFEYRIRRCLKFVNGVGVHPAILEVLAEADAFELISHKGASKLSDFDIKSINKMRGCLIEGCKEIETIVDGDSIEESVLQCLEVMYINNVPKLASIWEGVVRAGSLAQLKALTLCKCSNLKKIFSKGMIAQLSGLQNLKVEGCSEIEEIIMESENEGLEPDVLPNLKTLVLLDLLIVRSIWISDSIKWSSLKKIEISLCPLLTRLPFNNENAINLECIEVQQSWWDALEWKEDAIKDRLGPKCCFN
jgi:disease resistance protein RPS2